MARLSYLAVASLDGYIADEQGRWDWSVPDPAVHRFINDRMRAVGTHLYGRRMYDVMVAWETMDDPDPLMQDFAQIWRAADKIVYSTTMTQVGSARTRLERSFQAAEVHRLKESAARDLTIGGPHLAARAFEAGLVDDIHLFLSPVMVGGGTRAFPDGVQLPLELVDERRFANGVVHLHHQWRR